jgi:YfiR/HmsC-like
MLRPKRLGILFLVFAHSMTASSVAVSELRADEYALKAAFILNFARYSEWEVAPTRWGSSGLFVVCNWRQNLLGSAALENKTVFNLPVRIATISSHADVASCDVVFVAASNSDDLPMLLPLMQRHQVLSVTEQPTAGALNFLMKEGQVRFDCNLDVATNSDIKLSSQLIKLAVLVTGNAS